MAQNNSARNRPSILVSITGALLLNFQAAAGAAGFNISQSPLTITQSASPRVMLAMSRDHQLYIKAYTDYADLDGNGSIDTGYLDSYDYYGYFDSKKCYQYTNSRFEPANAASGTYGHRCNGGGSQWSGNFLNWATMTRMDIIRKVLYGGYRSTDTADTVLERTLIPYDVHSFAKVFTAASTAEMQYYVPYGQTVISLCSLTQGSGLAKDVDTASYPPLLRIAKGSYPNWAASEVTQCQWGSGTQPDNSQNLVSKNDDTGLNVRVKVCAAGLEESNCKTYGSYKKPTGLLQKYAEANKPIYFGLMTGSWAKNKSGGVLRRNIGPLTGNAAGGSNEISASTGQFLNQNTTDAGIINALNRFRISSYSFTDKNYKSSCNSPGILSFNNGTCVEWGNPLSETYLESLRYLSGKTSPAAAFSADDSGYIYSLPQVNWTDPTPDTEWCASHSVVVISTGLNSFDGDELSNDLGIDADSETNAVGSAEGISGSYLVGSNGAITDKECTAKAVANLSSASGICPEVPSLEGTYKMAGLAYYARTHDMRSDRSGSQKINTYTIALAESLPKFEIPVGSGKVNILPTCEANSGSVTATSGWRNCSMTDLTVVSLTYDSNGNLISGDLKINWEDSTWGNDYDMDGIAGLKFCVGSGCTPGAANNSAPGLGNTLVKVQASVLQANAGHSLRFGYTITGTTNDGVNLPILRPGGSNFNLGGALPAGVTPATTTTYTQGTVNAKLLENPLWYTAKYGGFETSDSSQNETPASQSWDKNNDGTPDAFFKATNPAKLEAALDSILNDVLIKSGSSGGIGANSSQLQTSSVIYQTKFNSATWTGQLLAYPLNSDGSIAGASSWDAGKRLTTDGAGSRSIFGYNPTASSTKGIDFAWNNLNASQQALLTVDQVNYLKGDRGQENPGGSLRRRAGDNALLGDLVNSDPFFIANDRNYGYYLLPGTEGSKYLTFLGSAALRARKPMIAVGGNDGMLHVFKATVGDADSGKELFGFVPSAILPNLASFTSPTYTASGNHKFFVDGSAFAGDVYFDADSDGDKEWRTVLVETLGAGGKGLFALDVSFISPADDAYATSETSFSAARILWEINTGAAPNGTDLTDDLSSSPKRYGFANYLGFTLGQASIVRMANGEFAAVFGNGYNSANQTAVLYIVNIKTGALIRSISTETGNTTSPNGLSTPITVDVNGDRIVDVIYAGDMQGNLWKFDVSGSNAANWKVAFASGSAPAPLFTAKDSADAAQPITAKPQVGAHPTLAGSHGVLVYFGTGKFFETGDNSVPASPQIQSFYGIRDACVVASGSSETCTALSPNASRSELVGQSILAEGAVGNYAVRVTSGNDTSLYGNTSKKGWYLSLLPPSGTAVGERVVAQALLRSGRVIFVTLIPDQSKCSYSGTSWLMELDALTGNRLPATPFDLTGNNSIGSEDMARLVDINNDGKVDANDSTTSVSGKKSTVGIIKTPAILEDGNHAPYEHKYVSGSSGSTETTYETNPNRKGRVSWRQLR